MDSLDLFRRCIWNIDSDEADARMEAVLAWVGESATPERVFSQAQLDHWATQNGYVLRDVKPIAALLRRVERYIPVHDPVGQDVRDMIHAYG